MKPLSRYLIAITLSVLSLLPAWATPEIEFCPVTESATSALPFKFQRIHSDETAIGYFLPTSVIPLSDLTGVWLTSREINTVPVTGFAIGFKKRVLDRLKEHNQPDASLLILFYGRPLATIKVSELTAIASRNEKLFVVAPSYPDKELIEKVKATNQKIDSLPR